jgi:hypothetical protein
MTVKEDALERLHDYFVGRGLHPDTGDHNILVNLTPEQGLVKLSPGFLELKIPVYRGGVFDSRPVSWILKSLIENGNDGRLILQFAVNDKGRCSLNWIKPPSPGGRWPWLIQETEYPASILRYILDPFITEEGAEPVSGYGHGTMRGAFADDLEMSCRFLERVKKHLWQTMPADGPDGMPMERQYHVREELKEAQIRIANAAKVLRG